MEKRKRSASELNGSGGKKQQLLTLQQRADEEFWKMADVSMIHFLVHVNECTTAMVNDSEETLARVKANQQRFTTIILSLINHVCDVLCPGIDKRNPEEVESVLGTVSTIVMRAVATNDLRFCNSYSRKGLIFAGMGIMPTFREWVFNECKNAPKEEQDRAFKMCAFIQEMTRLCCSGTLPTKSPKYSELESFVDRIETKYNLLEFETYHVFALIARECAYGRF